MTEKYFQKYKCEASTASSANGWRDKAPAQSGVDPDGKPVEGARPTKKARPK